MGLLVEGETSNGILHTDEHSLVAVTAMPGNRNVPLAASR
jgi:hypothetical protein